MLPGGLQDIEREKFEYSKAHDKQRLEHDQVVHQDRIALDRNKAARDGKFWSQASVIVPAAVALAALFLSSLTSCEAQKTARWATQLTEQNKHVLLSGELKDREVARKQATKKYYIDFVQTNKAQLYSDQKTDQMQMKSVLEAVELAFESDDLKKLYDSLKSRYGESWAVSFDYVWMPAGVGDCSGRDKLNGNGTVGFVPNVQQCDANTVNQIAVCWDNHTFKNGGRPWCTYKEVTLEQCVGGAAPGAVHRCAAVRKQK